MGRFGRRLLGGMMTALVASSGLGAAAQATENGFRREGDLLTYHVAGQRVSVPLDRGSVKRSEKALRQFSATKLASVVERDVLPYIEREYGDLLTVRVKPTRNGYSMNWSGPQDVMSKPLYADITEVAEEAKRTYYRERFMRLLQPSALYPAGGLIPDYPRLTALFKDDMAGLAQAVRRAVPSGDVRQKISFLTRFLQDIPYRLLNGRDPREGYGVLPPANLLSGNSGDCDSKALAFASVMRHLAPQLPVAFVLINGHAFVGVGLSAADRRHGDLLVPGTDLVAVEPVGPARLPVGEVGKDSLQALQTGRFFILPLEVEEGTFIPRPPRPAHLIAAGWKRGIWHAQFINAVGEPSEVAAKLNKTQMVPSEAFHLDHWRDQWIKETQDRLTTEIADQLETVLRIDLQATQDGWSWRVESDQEQHRADISAYNNLVAQINRLSVSKFSERQRLMSELDQRRAALQAYTTRRDQEFEIAKSRTQAVIEDARRRFELDRFIVTRENVALLDYGMVAASYAPRLAPLVAGLGRPGTEPRRWVADALVMLQALPLRPLDRNRAPKRVIQDRSLETVFVEGKASSTEKAVVLAALLRAAYPEVALAVLQAGQSAFVAMDLPMKSGDRQFTIGAKTYVAVDPAGPIFMPVGTLRDYFDKVETKEWQVWPVPSAS